MEMTSADRHARDIGNLEARMENVENELQAIRNDVREIRDALVRARGGWLLLTSLIALATGFSTLLSRFIDGSMPGAN